VDRLASYVLLNSPQTTYGNTYSRSNE